MPHISVSMYKGRSEEVKEGLAKKLQEAALDYLNCSVEAISVSITDCNPEDFTDYVEKSSKDGKLFLSSKFIYEED